MCSHATSIAILSLLTASLSGQSIRLSRDGGTLGKPVTVTVTGTTNRAFFLLPSFNAGPTALSLLDPSDPRKLQAGLDLIALASAGIITPTGTKVVLPTPNAAGLAGQTLYFHAFLFPGTTRLAGPLSNPIRATLGSASRWLARGKIFAAARAFPTVNRLANGNVLVAGGGVGNLLGARGLASTELWLADEQRFIPGPKMAIARALHRSVTLKNGKVLVIGGADQTGAPTRSCELYDPATNKFTSTGNLRTPRVGHTANLLPNGTVLVAGGTNNLTDVTKAVFGTLSSTEIYNPTTGTWSNGRNMSRRRLGAGSAVLPNGRILITGGVTVNFIFPGVTSRCEVYDPTSNRFSGTGSLPRAAAAQELTALTNGQVLATGGATLSGLTSIKAIPNAATYDPKTGRWSALPNMRDARSVHGAIQIAAGRVLILGGGSGDLAAPKALARCELLDLSTRKFSAAATLGIGRAAPAYFSVPEGFVVVAGGAGGTPSATLQTGEYWFLP